MFEGCTPGGAVFDQASYSYSDSKVLSDDWKPYSFSGPSYE
jgi:hypothetical protein